jgi:hypothetical protein
LISALCSGPKLQPIPQNDAHSPPRGLSGWSGYLIT